MMVASIQNHGSMLSDISFITGLFLNRGGRGGSDKGKDPPWDDPEPEGEGEGEGEFSPSPITGLRIALLMSLVLWCLICLGVFLLLGS